MSLFDQNQMLQVLHRNEVPRDHIKVIMKDLNDDKIFNDEFSDDDPDWRDVEEECAIMFSGKDRRQKIIEIRNLKKKREEIEKNQITQYVVEQEKRVRDKRQELINNGSIDPDKEVEFEDNEDEEIYIRYGRTPLHEAVAMKDLVSIEKLLIDNNYTEVVDNNGHTAMEMAFYEDYQEAMVLFKKYIPKSK